MLTTSGFGRSFAWGRNALSQFNDLVGVATVTIPATFNGNDLIILQSFNTTQIPATFNGNDLIVLQSFNTTNVPATFGVV